MCNSTKIFYDVTVVIVYGCEEALVSQYILPSFHWSRFTTNVLLICDISPLVDAAKTIYELLDEGWTTPCSLFRHFPLYPGLEWNCDGNPILSKARRFVFALILATSTPAASLPSWVVPESVYDDVAYIHMESALTTAYHTSPKPLRAISRKSVKSKHESSIYESLLASGSFYALHGSNMANWLEDVLFRLIFRGSQHQKKLKRSWYNTCSVTFHLSDCFVTQLQHQRDLV